MSILKGRALVMNAAGTVSIAGVATINTVNNADISDVSEVKKITGANGKVATLYKDETIKKVSAEITPGGTTAGLDGALVDAVAAGAMPTKLSTLVLSGFAITAFNGNFIIDEDSPVKIVSGGAATISVKGTQYEKDFTALAQIDAGS